jgi:hypothetical protein
MVMNWKVTLALVAARATAVGLGFHLGGYAGIALVCLILFVTELQPQTR